MTKLETIAALGSTNRFNSDILTTTLLIHQHCPELCQFLDEMPVTIPDMENPVISNQVLMDFNESLRVLLFRYSPYNH